MEIRLMPNKQTAHIVIDTALHKRLRLRAIHTGKRIQQLADEAIKLYLNHNHIKGR